MLDDSGGENFETHVGGYCPREEMEGRTVEPTTVTMSRGPGYDFLECAARYAKADDLFVISAYFNPARFAAKLRNFHLFSSLLEGSRLHWLAVECAFGDEEFSLPCSPRILQVRTNSVLWQKERLLNLALTHVPPNFTKIAWVDCDLLFVNPNWAAETADLLESHRVVQCFTQPVRLPRGHHAFVGEGDVGRSFASLYNRPWRSGPSDNYDAHGHTGFAWAARREFLEVHGLYDTCVAGGADHLMAHAFCGEFNSRCVDGLFGDKASIHRSHALAWCRKVHADVEGDVGCCTGSVLHLWHGDRARRRYLKRQYLLAETNFNPATDLLLNQFGCWEWSGSNVEAPSVLETYFASRREDGDP